MNPLVRRLTTVAAVSIALAWGGAVAHAQSSPLAPANEADVIQSLSPYMAIGNFPDDKGKVFMFFSFSCPFCQANWRGITAWGATLPESFRMVDVPVIQDDKSSQAGALAFYTVKALAPIRLQEFKSRAYQMAASQEATPEAYEQILLQMGLAKADIERYATSSEMRDRLRRDLQLTKRYEVNVTPSFGVGGQYETNANFTHGDYELLTRLLSGLVSRQIEQMSAR